jgi:hypothetical protein
MLPTAVPRVADTLITLAILLALVLGKSKARDIIRLINCRYFGSAYFAVFFEKLVK